MKLFVLPLCNRVSGSVCLHVVDTCLLHEAHGQWLADCAKCQLLASRSGVTLMPPTRNTHGHTHTHCLLSLVSDVHVLFCPCSSAVHLFFIFPVTCDSRGRLFVLDFLKTTILVLVNTVQTHCLCLSFSC